MKKTSYAEKSEEDRQAEDYKSLLAVESNSEVRLTMTAAPSLEAFASRIAQLSGLEELTVVPQAKAAALPRQLVAQTLTSLRVLNVEHNALAALPEEVGLLPALEWLFVSIVVG